ncbi:leucine rich repeat family protein [Anaeramoeba flamelloides]|uniref:Leucine rich repeat family protein n=1 Tax=Anaeramoeba flamelloides TaxID=1746091 RepID=A0AAV7ZS89_9EUKA|nr:leucine rich repeat family protein [Anaeramoeba flamelloides]
MSLEPNSDFENFDFWLGGFSESPIQRSISELKENKDLTSLDLSNSNPTKEELELICGLLLKNKKTKHLSFASCNITDRLLDPILNLFMNEDNQIETLDLTMNKITDIGAKRLLKITQKSNSLTELMVPLNDFSKKLKNEIEEIFTQRRQKKTLEKLIQKKKKKKNKSEVVKKSKKKENVENQTNQINSDESEILTLQKKNPNKKSSSKIQKKTNTKKEPQKTTSLDSKSCRLSTKTSTKTKTKTKNENENENENQDESYYINENSIDYLFESLLNKNGESSKDLFRPKNPDQKRPNFKNNKTKQKNKKDKKKNKVFNKEKIESEINDLKNQVFQLFENEESLTNKFPSKYISNLLVESEKQAVNDISKEISDIKKDFYHTQNIYETTAKEIRNLNREAQALNHEMQQNKKKENQILSVLSELQKQLNLN